MVIISSEEENEFVKQLSKVLVFFLVYWHAQWHSNVYVHDKFKAVPFSVLFREINVSLSTYEERALSYH